MTEYMVILICSAILIASVIGLAAFVCLVTRKQVQELTGRNTSTSTRNKEGEI